MAKEKINFEDEQVRLCYRHTTSHILAQAVKKLWPDAKPVSYTHLDVYKRQIWNCTH